MILAHAKFHYLPRGIGGPGPKPVVGFYAHVTCTVVLSSPVSLMPLSGDNILTSRSRYWFFISISKPLLAVMGTPLEVDISVNPLTR